MIKVSDAVRLSDGVRAPYGCYNGDEFVGTKCLGSFILGLREKELLGELRKHAPKDAYYFTLSTANSDLDSEFFNVDYWNKAPNSIPNTI